MRIWAKHGLRSDRLVQFRGQIRSGSGFYCHYLAWRTALIVKNENLVLIGDDREPTPTLRKGQRICAFGQCDDFWQGYLGCGGREADDKQRHDG